MVVKTNTETTTDKFKRLYTGQSSLITDDELAFIASVFEAMSPDRKGDFFANNSLLAVKVVGRQEQVCWTTRTIDENDLDTLGKIILLLSAILYSSTCLANQVATKVVE